MLLLEEENAGYVLVFVTPQGQKHQQPQGAKYKDYHSSPESQGQKAVTNQ